MSITKIISINEIPFNTYSTKDLLAFDLDDTIFVQNDKIMRSINSKQRHDFITDIINNSKVSTVKKMFENVEYRLVEDDTICHINNLQNRNIETVGFTARRTGFRTVCTVVSNEDTTLNILKNLNLSFKSDIFYDFEFSDMSQLNSSYSEMMVDPTLECYEIPGNVMIKNGVIFSNNIDKGIVMLHVFNKFKFIPEKFVLIDDIETNHISMLETINKINMYYGYNIIYEGYHYVGSIELLDNDVDADLISIQRMALLSSEPKYVSDATAQIIFDQI